MSFRLNVLSTVMALAWCACSPRPQAPRPHDASRADGGVAQRADGGISPRDPCDILQAEQRDLIVARVGDQSLTLCDFTRRVNSQNPYLRARFNAPEQRRALLQSWVDAELLANEAVHRNLDQDPQVRRAITMQLARRLEQWVREGVAEPTVTDDEVRAYFDAHRAEYDTEAQVRASQIVLGARADAERALADVRAHEDDDAYFRARVRAVSVDPVTRGSDGDMAFFPMNGGSDVVPEVAAAAFTLTRPGQILDRVVESAHGGPNHGPGFHVVRLTARRDAMHRTLDDESRRIRVRLQREKVDHAQDAAMQQLLDQLRRDNPVQVDDAALAQVRVDAPPPGTPAAMTGPGPLPIPH